MTNNAKDPDFCIGINALTAVKIPMKANVTDPHRSHLRFVSTVMAANAMAI